MHTKVAQLAGPKHVYVLVAKDHFFCWVSLLFQLPPGRVFVVCFTSSAEINAGMDSSTVTLDTKDDSVLDFRYMYMYMYKLY